MPSLLWRVLSFYARLLSSPSPRRSPQLADGSPQHQGSDGDLLTAAAPAPAAVLQPRVVTSETERLSREQAERERRKLAAAADPYADPEKLTAFVQVWQRGCG